MKKFLKVLAAIVLVSAILVLAGCFYTVRENQYAVVTQFGRIVHVESNAGLRMKMPVIQSISYLPKEIQIYDLSPSDVITRDKKSMIADDFVLWQITDPMKFMQTVSGSVTVAQDRVGVAVYNATKNTISAMNQDDIISARGDRLIQLVTDESNSDIGQYGIVILQAQIKALDLPDDNKDAVYERMISERNNIAAAYLADGEKQAKEIRNEADKEVEIRVAEAKAQAEILKAEGDAEYMRILSEVYDTEDEAAFYSFMIALDALKASMTGEQKTLILDASSPIAQLFY